MTALAQSLGGSQAAAAAGVHPYCPPIQLWRELRGELSVDGNEFTEWGTRLESAIRQKFAETHNVEIAVPTEPIFDAERSWMRASPDGLLLTRDPGSGLECKTANYHQRHRWGEGDHVPAEYLCQCHWYMAILDAPRWYLVVLIGGHDYREYVIERDREFEQLLRARVTWFWESYLAGQPPPLDVTAAYGAYLAAQYPADDPPVYIRADGTANEAARMLRLAMGRRREIDRTIDGLKNVLKASIGRASGIRTDDGLIYWKPTKDGRRPFQPPRSWHDD